MGFMLVFLLAYLLGSIPFGYLMVRLFQGKDVRDSGSGNIGATNFLRTGGRCVAVVTLALDGAKGYLAVLLTSRFTSQESTTMALATAAVVLGHVFPIFLKFRGGKGVATSAGAFLALSVISVLAAFLVFGIVVALTRIVSLGSITAGTLFPLLYFFTAHNSNTSLSIVFVVYFCSALVLLRHQENIRRLLTGTEKKLIGQKK